MFELLTCRTPLADINNPAVHVCNGGRPNITSEVGIILLRALLNCPSSKSDRHK